MHVIDGTFNILSLSLAFTLIGLNVCISSKILNMTDLTCDTSVTLGGCSYGSLVLYGIDPFVAFFVSMCLGAFAGFITASLISNVRMEPVLASIVTLTAFQTLIIKLCNWGNSCAKTDLSPLSSLPPLDNCLITAFMVTGTCILFYKMLNSEYGLAMRVYGGGRIISESMGINNNRMLCVGLMVGNGLAALAGALITQTSCSFSVNMGNGSIVFGLAAVIIGEKMLNPKTVKEEIAGYFLGALIYKLTLELATLSGASLGSEYNNVTTAAVLTFLMAIMHEKKKRDTLENI
jgi:putative ABC transport system permease protein